MLVVVYLFFSFTVVALCKNFRVISQLPNEALFILWFFSYCFLIHFLAVRMGKISWKKKTKASRTNLSSIIIVKELDKRANNFC